MKLCLQLVCLLLFSDATITASAVASPAVWIEAENYESQRGSTAPKFTMPSASGEACIDNDWGGQAGQFLRYKFELDSNFSVLHVTLRYARETKGDAVVSVTLDWDTNTTRIVRLTSTACWYEEIDHQPPRGHGDPADVWAAAEMVYLTRQLVLAEDATRRNKK
jgi:hypothetical protein